MTKGPASCYESLNESRNPVVRLMQIVVSQVFYVHKQFWDMQEDPQRPHRVRLSSYGLMAGRGSFQVPRRRAVRRTQHRDGKSAEA